MAPRLVVLVLCSSLLGCTLDLARIREEMTPRARSDLSCKGSLEFEELKQTLAASNLKVTGCGKTAEYVLVQSQWRLVQPLRPADPPSPLEPKRR